MYIPIKFSLLLSLSATLFTSAMQQDNKISEKPKQAVSSVIDTLLRAGAVANKKNTNNNPTEGTLLLTIKPDVKENAPTEEINTSRVSACTKISKFFENIKACFFTCKKRSQYKVCSIISKPAILNFLTVAPLAVEAAGGYCGHVVGTDPNTEITRHVATLVGTTAVIPLIESLYSRKWPINWGMLIIVLPASFAINSMVMCSGQKATSRCTIAIIASTMFTAFSFLGAFICNLERITSMTRFECLKKLLKMPFTIMIYIPCHQWRSFLKNESENFLSHANALNLEQTFIERIAADKALFPPGVAKIIEEYSISEQEYALQALTKITEHHSSVNALAIIQHIFDYAHEGQFSLLLH